MTDARQALPLSCTAMLIVAAGVLFSSAPAKGGVPDGWNIELVARSSESTAIPHFNLDAGAMIENQHVVIDGVGTVAIRVAFAGGFPADGVWIGPDPLVPGVGWFPVLNNDAGNPLSPDIDLFLYHLAVLDPDPIDGGTSGEGSIRVINTLTGATIADLPTRHPDYPEDTLSLAWDDTVGVRTRIGLAGYAINIDDAGPPRDTRTLISTLDMGNDPVDFIGPMMSPWSKTFVSVEQPYFETPPGPPRVLVSVAPVEGPPEGHAGRTRTVIDTAEGDIDRLAGYAAISENDRIAAISRRAADGVWQIARYDAPGSATHIADLTHFDPADRDTSTVRPAINSEGLVAFRARDASGAASLRVSDGVDTATIVAPGDVIETDLGPLALGFAHPQGPRLLNGRVDLNERNEIAFTAWLENGTIGVFIATPDPACNPADLAEPFAVLDLADIQAFVAAFTAQQPPADLAAPDGVWDLADIEAFVKNFNAGCP